MAGLLFFRGGMQRRYILGGCAHVSCGPQHGSVQHTEENLLTYFVLFLLFLCGGMQGRYTLEDYAHVSSGPQYGSVQHTEEKLLWPTLGKLTTLSWKLPFLLLFGTIYYESFCLFKGNAESLNGWTSRLAPSFPSPFLLLLYFFLYTFFPTTNTKKSC